MSDFRGIDAGVVRVTLPRGYDVYIRWQYRARGDDCVRMAARTRLSPRCSNNRAFCIDGTVSSGTIHETVGNILVGRVCLPRSVRLIGQSVIPLAVSFYAISTESGLTHPNHGSGGRGEGSVAGNCRYAASKEPVAAVRAAAGFPYARGSDMAACSASGSTQGLGTPHRSGSVKKAEVTGQSAEFHSSFFNQDEIRRLRPFSQLREKLSVCSATPNRKPCAGRRHGRCAPR